MRKCEICPEWVTDGGTVHEECLRADRDRCRAALLDLLGQVDQGAQYHGIAENSHSLKEAIAKAKDALNPKEKKP